MRLNDDEKAMLDGYRGDVVRRAMELLVQIGEATCAEEMVDVTAAHLLTIGNDKDSIYKLTSELMGKERAVVRATTHALPYDIQQVDSMGLKQEVVDEIKAANQSICRLYDQFGAIPTYTCMPNEYYDFRLGEHLAFTDSQVVPLINSWFGAMTNMETPASAIASALTGKTPKYGMHLKENRYGDTLVDIGSDLDAESFDRGDYAALAYWTGKLRVDGLPVRPVYRGVSLRMTIGEAKNMALPNTWNSGSEIFHVVGVTPEAPATEAALGGRLPKARFSFGRKELADAYRGLTSATNRDVEAVVFGCPHCTIEELQQIASLLEGKRINAGTRLFVGVSRSVMDLGRRMGITDILEKAGATLLTDCCASFFPVLATGARVVATNAGAFYMVPVISQGNVSVWFGTTGKCARAAITGRWEA